jgi:hypothetical protein
MGSSQSSSRAAVTVTVQGAAAAQALTVMPNLVLLNCLAELTSCAGR